MRSALALGVVLSVLQSCHDGLWVGALPMAVCSSLRRDDWLGCLDVSKTRHSGPHHVMALNNTARHGIAGVLYRIGLECFTTDDQDLQDLRPRSQVAPTS